MMNFNNPPRYTDVFILSLFTVLILFNPYFANSEINIFEVGLYLPCINAVLRGMVPYGDFFYLRGPLEIYMPAALMKLFGAHLSVLYLYFYAGTVILFLVCILLAKELYRSRLILYLMVPVLIGRTFPRVVYTFWGGMRYVFGLLAVYFAIRFFRKQKHPWMFFSG